VLTTEFISCDMRTWPQPWRRVLRFRARTASDDADRPDLTAGGAVTSFIFEVFAGRTRVLHARISERRLVLPAAADATSGAAAAESAAADDDDAADCPAEFINIAEYMDANMDREEWENAADAADGIERAEDAADEDESGGTDAEEEESDSRELLASAEEAVDVESAHVRASKLADQDTMLTALDPSAGVPGGWGGSSASMEGGEEDSSSTAVATCGAAALIPGTCYFRNPLYLPVRRGGTGAKKDELIFPLYTLFHYHGLLFAATGPLIRKMFPNLVSHSSHVEGKFSDMRRETAGSQPLEDYVRAKISGENSLMVGRCRLTVSQP